MTGAARTALLSELGNALGCYHEATAKSVEIGPGMPISTSPEERIDGLPARCYYTGPLIAADPIPRAPKIQTGALTHMDREARELADRGRADIIRFCQIRDRARKARA